MVLWSVEPNDAVGHRRLSIPVDNVEWEPWIIYGHHVLTPPWSGRAILTSEDVSTGTLLVIGKIKNPNGPTATAPRRGRPVRCWCRHRLRRGSIRPARAASCFPAWDGWQSEPGQAAAAVRPMQAGDGEPGHNRRRHQCASCRLASAAASRRTVSGADACVRCVY
jgi:hypothetical protein